MERIYLDHAATTPLDPAVLEAMLPYLGQYFGNPSSIHSFGREAKKALEDAREIIAGHFGVSPAEVIFTSGGSEADNLAIKGIAFQNRSKGNHIITSSIEHHAVLDTCKFLENNGFRVTYLPVDEYGLVSLKDVEKAITKDTILITIMHANNEVGTIEPIEEIGLLARERNIIFHTDAVQTVGTLPVNCKDRPIDMLSLSAHKFYGPKGVGALICRKGIKLQQLVHGGAQERNRRAGTENVAGIIGMAKALSLAAANMSSHNEHLKALRDYLIKGVMSRIEFVRLNGHPTKRLPGNCNFSFEYIEGESVLLNLDLKGIAASSGSACTSGSLEPSHVLLAMGLPPETAHGSLRITFGRHNTMEHVDYVLQVLPGIVAKLREMSPLYAAKKKEEDHV